MFTVGDRWRSRSIRRRAKRRASVSEADFGAVLEHASGAILVVDRRRRIRVWNLAAAELFGYSTDEMIGESWSRLVPERFRDRHGDEILSFVSDETDRRQFWGGSDVYAVRSDGKEFHVEITLSNIDLAEGPFVMASVRDVNDRVEAENALRAQGDWFEALVSNSYDSLSVVDSDGTYTYIKPVEGGYSVDEMIGRPFRDFVHPDDVQLFDDTLAGVARNGDGASAEIIYRGRFPEGNRWVEVRFTNLLGNPAVNGIAVNGRDISERVEAEKSRRAEADRLEALVSNSFDSLAVFDVDGTITFIEPLEGGDSVDALIGRPFRDWVHPDDVQLFDNTLAAVVQGGHLASAEVIWRGRFPEGHRWLEARITNLLDNPAVNGIVSNRRDISDRVETEKALRAQAYRFETLASNSYETLAVFDVDGTTTYLQPVADGYSVDAMIERSFRDFIHPDDVQLFDDTLAGVVRDGHLASAEVIWRGRFPEGHRWLEARITNLLDNPAVNGIVLNERDISERVDLEQQHREQLESAVAESAARSRSLLETSEDAIVVVDGDGTVDVFNPAAARMFGYEADEVIGRNVKMLMTWPYHLADSGGFSGDDETGELRTVGGGEQMTGRRSDGSSFPLDLAVAKVAWGSRVLFTGVARDMTETIAAQEAMLAATAMAERANLAKSEFLSRMSHELRTPLNSVLGFAQILEINLGDHPQQENVHYIYEAGRHLLSLIDEVLDISRIEIGSLAVSLEPVNVGLLIRECLDLVAPQAAERNIEVINRNGHDRHVSGDRQRLKQVLLNLLSNAIKFNHDDGNVTVDVDAGDNDWVRVTVTDTGPGVAPESVDKLFTPFGRLDADVSQIQGTGLGLALSKGLMEAMGGAIGVDSVHGHHSAFWFELPACTPQDAADECDGSPLVADPQPSTEGTLLYIEDNLSNIRLIEQLLRRRPQVKLVSAMQGSLGLELARQHQPDLILLDVHLPDMSGDVVLDRLRADPRTANIEVVIVSADATESQIRRFRQAGASDYLTKPLDLRRLLALLDEHITADGP